MGTHNLAALARSVWPPQRWHLVVLVRSVELVAGEISALVSDPTGEAVATIHRQVPKLWPHAASEGSVLLLTNVVALPPVNQVGSHQHSAGQRGARGAAGATAAGEHPRLLVMERSLGRCFAPVDATPEESARLLAEAKANLNEAP